MSLAVEKTDVDLYPSRNGHPAVILSRTEPVVYNRNADQSPVDYELIQQYEKNGFLILNNVFTVDVLSNPEIRQGIKEYSNWPTIPQLYIDGKFIGGSDILTEMYQNGELQKLIKK